MAAVVAALAALAALLSVTVLVLGLVVVELRQTRADLDRVEAGSALVSAGLGVLWSQFATDPDGALASINEVGADLERLRTTPLEVPFLIDETFAVETEFLVQQELVVPFETTIAIDETLATTIEVLGPLGLAVPVDVTVPVRLDVPVATDVSIRLDERFPVSTSVPVRQAATLQLDLADSELGRLLDGLVEALASLRALLEAA